MKRAKAFVAVLAATTMVLGLVDVAVLLIKQILQNQKANQNLLHLQT